ncbi:VOC family protein [Sporosarcina sp. Te-1]|uniref:VOC family protein n=1 Tax=Sporosarcina sp. Te-1 TaxID=2818390 RepID=UPI001A9D5F3B|nr:VOC family protein [Sporosarcina sp. Te-1]QTD40276.1 VOC family protein [Sporosarcina sp. Te-1]
MEFLFDHVVHFVHEPKETVAQFRDIGFHAIEGGIHESLGTYNGLCYLDLSYIEFLGHGLHDSSRDSTS